MTPSVPTSPAGASLPAGTRCGVHPVRRAVDRCPVCARPRCAADAELAPGGGCPSCGGTRDGKPARTSPPPTSHERLVRAALAASGVALIGGLVASQYVDAQLFAYLTPFVVGVLTGAAAQSAAGGSTDPRAGRTVRVVAAVYAVVGVALGFSLEQSTGVLDSSTLLPYAAAVAGVVLWTLPPKSRAAADDADER